MAATQAAHANAEELLATLRKAWESAPPEMKEAIPNVFTAAGNLISVWVLHDGTIEPVNKVLRYATNPAHVCKPETAKFYVQQAKNNTGVLTHSKDVVDCMTSNAELPEHVKLSIADGLRKSANAFLITSTICATVQVFVSAASLWELYKSVKEARNLTRASQIKSEAISKKLQLIPGKLAELDKILMELSQPDLAIAQVTRLANKANRIKTAIDSQLRDIVREIDNLELEISSRKIRLGAARRQAYISGASSLVNGGTSALSVGLLKGVASPHVLWVAGVVAACNVVLGLACPLYAYITEKELQKIQTRLDDICTMKANVEELEMKLAEQMDQIYDRIEELTETTDD